MLIDVLCVQTQVDLRCYIPKYLKIVKVNKHYMV